jgi:polar amino acid transport system permease protein
MNWSWLPEYLPLFEWGLWLTIILTVSSMFFGLLIGIPVGLVQVTGPKWLANIASGYCTVMRGTPLLVQIYLFYYGIGTIFPSIPGLKESIFWPILREGFFYAMVGFALNEGGYLGEIMRGAFLSVPKGELEAARAIGMSPWKVLTRVWLPRAVRGVLPTLAGETVLTLKATPIAATITVLDIFGVVYRVRQATYLTYEPLLFAAAIYMTLTLLITRVFRYFELQIPTRRS